MTSRIGWVDATSGVSGDMLLGACVDAGVDLGVIRSAIDRLGLPEAVTLDAERVQRGSLGATKVHVRAPSSRCHRTLPDVLALLERAEPAVADRAAAVFRVLAEAESRVHAAPVDSVHFHEVGALDSIADVVGVVAALHSLDLDAVVCSPIALGGGRADTEHGSIPVPGPAVIELLRAHRAPGFGGPIELELATPTGVALMVTLAETFGPMPAMATHSVGVGAGGRDPADHPNITRLVIGDAVAGASQAGLGAGDQADVPGGAVVESAVVLEANVDDLDPRLWPEVLAALMAAGASDAWLTPIAMKKGRPAHTLSVLAEPDAVERLERVVFMQTSTIGLRRRVVEKVVLPREIVTVQVLGSALRVKLARLDGQVVNAVPEYDDVVRLAANSKLPVRTVLDAASAAATAID